LQNKIGIDNVAELLGALEHDGLVRQLASGRVRLP
jgi:hypothetical protein